MGVNTLQWYYTQQLGTPGDVIELMGDEWHHCHHVMRLSVGDLIILTNGKGDCMEGIIRQASPKLGTIELKNDQSSFFKDPRDYTLYIGMAPTKNIDRTEFAVEKLVEIGVDEICFLNCRFGERNKVRIDRLEKIVHAASKQSKKTNFATLHDLMTPEMYIKKKKIENSDTILLCCHLDETSMPLFQNYLAGQNVMLLVGPEGGFANEELQMMESMNLKKITLGAHRLRVETAAITACNAIHFINQMKNTL